VLRVSIRDCRFCNFVNLCDGENQQIAFLTIAMPKNSAGAMTIIREPGS
jgi:hypothetical protein